MSLLDILEFKAPLSRVEEILQNILGASNEVDPESRVEKLLQNLIEVAYEVDPYSRVELLLDNLLGGHNEVVPMSRVEMLIANALGESYDVVPQSRVEELLVLLAEQYAVEYKTVSGSVVSISDALEAPMQSLVVDINPVQDLHGYDSPWPAGGGKNKFDKDGPVLDGYYIANTGKITAAEAGAIPSSVYTDYIPVSSSTAYCISAVSSGIAYIRVAEYDSEQTFIKRSITSRVINPSLAITTEATTKYIRVSPDNVVSDIQIEIGSTRSTYSPYSNICPITGWTGAEVYVRGTNQWDEEWELGYINPNTGAEEETTQKIRMKNYMPILPNTTYYKKTPVAFWNVYFDVNKVYVGKSFTAENEAFTTPSNAYFYRCGFETAYGTTYNHDISINYPSTDHDYHAYTGNTYPVSWETEAGTVYGGTLDVVSGELVVDRASVDLGTLSWTTASSGRHNTVNPTGIKVVPNTTTMSGACSQYVVTKGNSISATECSIGMLNGTSLQVNDSNLNGVDATAFKTAMNGVQLVYELATPITYHLTPTEVRTLLGTNNVWADTGDVEVTYLRRKGGE